MTIEIIGGYTVDIITFFCGGGIGALVAWYLAREAAEGERFIAEVDHENEMTALRTAAITAITELGWKSSREIMDLRNLLPADHEIAELSHAMQKIRCAKDGGINLRSGNIATFTEDAENSIREHEID